MDFHAPLGPKEGGWRCLIYRETKSRTVRLVPEALSDVDSAEKEEGLQG